MTLTLVYNIVQSSELVMSGQPPFNFTPPTGHTTIGDTPIIILSAVGGSVLFLVILAIVVLLLVFYCCVSQYRL